MIIYLYVKTHQKTNLKYLGMTTNSDPHAYSGSGVYWKNHLNKHGLDFSTEILRECSSKEEVKEWGIYYSRLWDIVESKEWANLKEEQGDGGRQSKTVREKIGRAGKGRTPWNKGKKMWNAEQRKSIGERNRQRGPQSQETIAKRTKKTTGKIRTEEQKLRSSVAQKGRKFTEEHKEKLKLAAQSRTTPSWNKGLTSSTPSATAKQYVITNLETQIAVEIISLRKWCLENGINYQMFHRNLRQGKSYKGHSAIESNYTQLPS
jgi:hypothetical protein